MTRTVALSAEHDRNDPRDKLTGGEMIPPED